MNVAFPLQKSIPKGGTRDEEFTDEQLSQMSEMLIELQTENTNYKTQKSNLKTSIKDVGKANQKLQKCLSDRRSYYNRLYQFLQKNPQIYHKFQKKYQEAKNRLKNYQKNFEKINPQLISTTKVNGEIDSLKQKIIDISDKTANLMADKQDEEKTIKKLLQLKQLNEQLNAQNQELRNEVKGYLDMIDYDRLKRDPTYENRITSLELVLQRIDLENGQMSSGQNPESFSEIIDKISRMNAIFSDLKDILNDENITPTASTLALSTLFQDNNTNNTDTDTNINWPSPETLKASSNSSMINTSSLQLPQSPISKRKIDNEIDDSMEINFNLDQNGRKRNALEARTISQENSEAYQIPDRKKPKRRKTSHEKIVLLPKSRSTSDLVNIKNKNSSKNKNKRNTANFKPKKNRSGIRKTKSATQKEVENNISKDDFNVSKKSNDNEIRSKTKSYSADSEMKSKPKNDTNDDINKNGSQDNNQWIELDDDEYNEPPLIKNLNRSSSKQPQQKQNDNISTKTKSQKKANANLLPDDEQDKIVAKSSKSKKKKNSLNKQNTHSHKKSKGKSALNKKKPLRKTKSLPKLKIPFEYCFVNNNNESDNDISFDDELSPRVESNFLSKSKSSRNKSDKSKSKAKYDKNGNRIDNDGNLIDKNGNIIDKNGNIIDKNGNIIDKNGNIIDKNGNIIGRDDSLFDKNENRTDKYGNRIDKNGDIIDKNGNVIGHNGYFIDPNGILFDKNRNKIDKNGNIVDKNGNQVDKYGNRIDKNGDIIDKNGNVIGHNGSFIDADSNLIDEDGNIIDKYGNKIDKDGNIYDKNGKQVDKYGNRIAKNGDIIDRHGNVIGHDGSYIDKNGNIIDKNGNLVDKNGNIIGTSNYLIDKNGFPIDEHGNRIDTKSKNTNISQDSIESTKDKKRSKKNENGSQSRQCDWHTEQLNRSFSSSSDNAALSSLKDKKTTIRKGGSIVLKPKRDLEKLASSTKPKNHSHLADFEYNKDKRSAGGEYRPIPKSQSNTKLDITDDMAYDLKLNAKSARPSFQQGRMRPGASVRIIGAINTDTDEIISIGEQISLTSANSANIEQNNQQENESNMNNNQNPTDNSIENLMDRIRGKKTVITKADQSSTEPKLPHLNTNIITQNYPKPQQQLQLGRLQKNNQSKSPTFVDDILSPTVSSYRGKGNNQVIDEENDEYMANGSSLLRWRSKSSRLLRNNDKGDLFNQQKSKRFYQTEFTDNLYITKETSEAEKLEKEIFDKYDYLKTLNKEIEAMENRLKQYQLRELSNNSKYTQTKMTMSDLNSIEDNSSNLNNADYYAKQIDLFQNKLNSLRQTLKQIRKHNGELQMEIDRLNSKAPSHFPPQSNTQAYLAARRLRKRFEMALKSTQELNKRLDNELECSNKRCSDIRKKIQVQRELCDSLNGRMQGKSRMSASEYQEEIENYKTEERNNQEYLKMLQIEMNFLDNRISSTTNFIQTSLPTMEAEIKKSQSRLDILRQNSNLNNTKGITTQAEIEMLEEDNKETDERIEELQQRKTDVTDIIQITVDELKQSQIPIPPIILSQES